MSGFEGEGGTRGGWCGPAECSGTLSGKPWKEKLRILSAWTGVVDVVKPPGGVSLAGEMLVTKKPGGLS